MAAETGFVRPVGWLAVLSLLVSACVPENTRPNRYEPEYGVECYRDRQVCYDQDGPSVYHTRQYFGDFAADDLIEWLESGAHGGQPGGSYRPPTQDNVFYPVGGVRCVRTDGICYGDFGPSIPATERWLGYIEARDLSHDIERGQHPEFEPEAEVRCSRRDGYCSYRGRSDVSYTRRWLDIDLEPPPPATQSNVFYPDSGVRCVRSEGICYLDYGPSVPDTERWLGRGAANGLERDIRNGGHRHFVPENQVHCSRPARACTYRGETSPSHTRRWLDVDPSPPRGPDRPAQTDTYTPQAGVRCVRSEQVCYRGREPDLAATRQYFGRDAGERLERQLNPAPPPVQRPEPAPAPGLNGRLKVTVRYPGNAPRNGVLHVALKAGNPVPGRSPVIVKRKVNLSRTGWPVTVVLDYEQSDIVVQFRYLVDAWIERGGQRVARTSDQPYVLTRGAEANNVTLDLR